MIDTSALWAHQLKTYEFGLTRNRIYDLSSAGCVSHDTEFLTPSGWKRICDYAGEDMVGQINPSTLSLSFAKPLDYVKKQCSVMYHVNPARGMSMMISSEHRVLYYARKDLSSWGICSGEEFAKKPEMKYIAATFSPDISVLGLALNDAQLRLMIAVVADGHFVNGGRDKNNACVIRVKKDRKKIRLVSLLNDAGVQFKRREGSQESTEFGFSIFSFEAPLKDKVFDAKYWGCNVEQLRIICDEVLFWDGDHKASFFTSQKLSADFIQYVFSACGYPTSLSTYDRERMDRKCSVEYVVTKRAKAAPFVGTIRPESVQKVRPKVPYKYCFTTETSFWLARHNGYIFVTGNTGKTIAHAKLAEHFLANEQGTRVLVVCPKTLMRSAWKQEFSKYMPYITVGLAEAPESNRKAVFESKCSVVVMNTDGLAFLAGQSKTWLTKHLGKKPMLIIDESSSIKNPNSIRTKAALKVASYFDRIHLLSATPAPNSVTEIWPQAKVLDGGKRLGTRFTAFRNLMQRPVFNGPFRQWEDAPDAAAITYGLLADVSIRHDFDDVMTHVPAMSDMVMYYDLSSAHMKQYQLMEKQAFLEFGDETISSLNAAGLANKLLQIASGAVYNDPTSDEKGWSIIDSGRYEMIAELCEPRPHTVVFFTWKHQKAEIIKELEKKKLSYAVLDGSVKSSAKREEIVNDFEAGKYRVILLHPLTGAHGLTLTKGTTIIWASPTYNADWFQQGNARIRRGRQTLPTQSITILARDTRDFDAYETFTGKNTRMTALNNLFARRYGEDNATV